MAHRFVEKVFTKGLRVVYGKGGNKCDDHFPNQRVPGRPKAQDTFRCIHEVLAHELKGLRIGMDLIEHQAHHATMKE
jgi:hypothetical protein